MYLRMNELNDLYTIQCIQLIFCVFDCVNECISDKLKRKREGGKEGETKRKRESEGEIRGQNTIKHNRSETELLT